MRGYGHRIASSRLLHFTVLGAALFAVAPRSPSPRHVVVTEDEVIAVLRAKGRTRGAPLSPEEKSDALRGYVESEVLFREGVRLGFDKDDPALRSAVVERMRAHIREGAAPRELRDAELAAFFAAHPGRWRLPPRAIVDSVFFPSRPAKTSADGGADRTSMEGELARLRAAPDSPLEGLGEEGPLPRHGAVDDTAAGRASLGTALADAVFGAPVGPWTGPVATPYGFVLLRVRERLPAREPAAFTEVRADVAAAAGAEDERKAEEAFVASLLRRYQVTVAVPAGEPVQLAHPARAKAP